MTIMLHYDDATAMFSDWHTVRVFRRWARMHGYEAFMTTYTRD